MLDIKSMFTSIKIMIVVYCTSLTAAGQNEIVLFEDFETPKTENFITYFSGDMLITSNNVWQVTADSIDLFETTDVPEVTSFDGTQALDMTGTPGAGVIETSFKSQVGQFYELIFHYAHNALIEESADAQVDVLGATVLLNQTVQHNLPFDQFLEFRDNFAADSNMTTLRFSSLDFTGLFGVTIDGISIRSFTIGDVNGDSVVNLLDVAQFVDRVSTGIFQAEADVNQDGVVNLLDVGSFIALLNG